MKKIFGTLLVALLLVVAAPVQAQLHFGVKGGLNLSKLDISEKGLKGDNKAGWFIGPMAEFTLPIIGIGVDAAVLYSQTDFEARQHATNEDVYWSTSGKLKTFEIPVNLKWSFGLGSMLGVYLAAGPQFGFNIGDRSFNDLHFEKGTTSFNVGAGVKLIRHLQIGVNYNIPLNNTGRFEYKEEGGSGSGVYSKDIKNKTWQISLAYLF